MKKKALIILIGVVIVVAINCAILLLWVFCLNPWHENRSNLDATVFIGAEIQLVADCYNAHFNRYPTDKELTNLLQRITVFSEGVSTNSTNKIVPKFDDTGGWIYNEENGRIALNCQTKDVIGFQIWVDPSKINFHPLTDVDVVHFGKAEKIDYSWVNERLSKMKPEIEGIIKNLAATNKVEIQHGLKRGITRSVMTQPANSSSASFAISVSVKTLKARRICAQESAFRKGGALPL